MSPFLEVHHAIPVKDGGSDDSENLWTVCTDCHKLIHARRLEFSKYLFEVQ
jgi:predicted HNH restriction endonuclease